MEIPASPLTPAESFVEYLCVQDITLFGAASLATTYSNQALSQVASKEQAARCAERLRTRADELDRMKPNRVAEEIADICDRTAQAFEARAQEQEKIIGEQFAAHAV